jgi:hypothetical protein
MYAFLACTDVAQLASVSSLPHDATLLGEADPSAFTMLFLQFLWQISSPTQMLEFHPSILPLSMQSVFVIWVL